MRRSMLRRILAKRHMDHCSEIRGLNQIGDEGFVLLAIACANLIRGQEIATSLGKMTCRKYRHTRLTGNKLAVLKPL